MYKVICGAAASQCCYCRLHFPSCQYSKWKFCPYKPSAISTLCHQLGSPYPSVHVQDMREDDRHRLTCPALGLSDLPHFTPPPGVDVRPLKTVDEIIGALWPVYCHNQHSALSRLFSLLMSGIFMNLLVGVTPATLKHRLMAVRAV